MIHRFSHDTRADRLTRWNLLAIGVSIFLGLLVIPSLVQGKTIFDDDWVPPKSDTPVQPPAQTPPATQPVTPPESIKPKTSVNTPLPPPTVAVPVHRPIPAKADQAKSRKLFKEFYAADLANRSAAGRRALATKLLEQAGAVSDAPSDQFVLLVGATEAAKEASDLALVSRAADALADAYEVDGLHVKSDAATQMVLRSDSPAATTENCRNGLELVDQLAAAGDFVAAQHLLKSLQAASPDAELRSQIQSKTKEVDAQKAAAERIAMFSQKLKTAPDDPVANLAVGQHLCFVKGDWAHGLPLLAKGTDVTAKSLAAQELKNPADTDGQLAVADGWWSYADSQHDPERSAIQSHAQDVYREALPGLKGLAKLKAETRLTERIKLQAPSLNSERQFTNSIGMKFVRIEPGTFTMGSPESDLGRVSGEGSQHQVTLTHGFYLCQTLTTQEEYLRVMETNPSKRIGAKNTDVDMSNFPVENVSCDEAIEFCRKLSEMPREKQLGHVYRLPTEAEWEYACRAGTKTAFYFGDEATPKDANIGSVKSGPTRVASYPPNPWGLYDMCGNVWEWCLDDNRHYDGKPVVDPRGTGSSHVRRGGQYNSPAIKGRSAGYREGSKPDARNPGWGFRVVMESGPDTENGAVPSKRVSTGGSSGAVVDLLKLDEQHRKVYSGTWSFEPDGLHCIAKGKILFDYSPPEEYDIHVEYARQSQSDAITLFCPLQDGVVAWSVGGWTNTKICFFHFVKGEAVPIKEMLFKSAVTNGQRMTSTVYIRKGSAEGIVNGKADITIKTDGSGDDVGATQINGRHVIGVSVRSDWVIYELKVTELHR